VTKTDNDFFETRKCPPPPGLSLLLASATKKKESNSHPQSDVKEESDRPPRTRISLTIIPDKTHNNNDP